MMRAAAVCCAAGFEPAFGNPFRRLMDDANGAGFIVAGVVGFFGFGRAPHNSSVALPGKI